MHQPIVNESPGGGLARRVGTAGVALATLLAAGRLQGGRRGVRG